MSTNNSNLQEQLTYLEHQIKRMVARYEDLKVRYEASLEDKKQQKQIIDKQKDTLKNFQNKLNFNNIVSAKAGETVDFEALKQKIDAYIGEIDKTIQYLNE
jgi:hypothetical protein